MHASTKLPAFLPLVLSIVGLASSCVHSRSEVVDEARVALLDERTYLWVEEPMPGPEGAIREMDDALLEEARSTVAVALGERGFREAPDGEAAVFMALRLDATEEVTEVDPYFAQNQLERYEKGHLTLTAYVPVTYEEIWRARSEVRLRTTARAMGTLTMKWKQLDEQRDWQLARLAAAAVDRLP